MFYVDDCDVCDVLFDDPNVSSVMWEASSGTNQDVSWYVS